MFGESIINLFDDFGSDDEDDNMSREEFWHRLMNKEEVSSFSLRSLN